MDSGQRSSHEGAIRDKCRMGKCADRLILAIALILIAAVAVVIVMSAISALVELNDLN